MENKDQTEIINKIVTAEHDAQNIVNKAKQALDLLAAEISGEKKKMRDLYLSDADKQIEAIKLTENQAADEAISQLDKKLEEELAAVEKLFKENRSVWVSNVFSKVTDRQ
jgi:hypothetical protein